MSIETALFWVTEKVEYSYKEKEVLLSAFLKIGGAFQNATLDHIVFIPIEFYKVRNFNF